MVVVGNSCFTTAFGLEVALEVMWFVLEAVDLA